MKPRAKGPDAVEHEKARAEFAAFDQLPPVVRAALREGGMSAVNALGLLASGLSETDVLEAIAQSRGPEPEEEPIWEE